MTRRALLVLVTALLVPAAPGGAHLGTINPAVKVAGTGTLFFFATPSGGACAGLGDQTVVFGGAAVEGVLGAPSESYVGEVITQGGITSCVNHVVAPGGNPMVSIGSIRPPGTTADFASPTPSPVTGHCLAGDIDAGSVVFVGAAGLQAFSGDYDVTDSGPDGNCNTVDDFLLAGGSATNVPCVGTFALVSTAPNFASAATEVSCGKA